MPLSEFTHRRRVAFHEVDSAGIVHFSVYFRYMEEAEHAMWRAAGMSIARKGADVGFPRVSASCDYFKPLRFEDEFETHIRVVAITEKSLTYACALSCQGETIARGSIVVVCVSRTADGAMKARAIPPGIASLFAVSGEVGA